MGNKPKFNDEKAVKAFVNCAKKIGDVKNCPVKSELFRDVCAYLKIRKNVLEKFQTNVKFAWNNNLRSFKTRIEEGVRQKLGKKNGLGGKYKIQVEDDSEEKEDSEEGDDSEENEDFEDSEKIDRNEYPLQHLLYVSREKIIRQGRISSELLHAHLRKILPRELLIPCVLQWKGIKFTNNDNFRDYAQCKQPKCQEKFKFHGVMQDSKLQIKIFQTGVEGEHTEPFVYQLRDEERTTMQEKLLHMKPGTMYTKLINEGDIDLAQKHNNYQFMHTREVIQVARSTKLGEFDRNSDDGADIYLRVKEANFNHPYIREFRTSFTTYLACEEQVEILRNYRNLILHFDATGKLIRKSFHRSKRVYYYAGVVVIDKKIYLIMALITNSHTTRSISEFLTFMKNHWGDNGITWPAFEAFVTDFSWASINALMTAFNDMTVVKYLQIVYKELHNGILRPKNLILSFTCYAHIMKMLSRYLKDLKINEEIVKLFLEAMTVVIHSPNLTEMNRRVELLFTVILTPKRNKDVLDAIKELAVLIEAQEKQVDGGKKAAEGREELDEETEELSDETKKPIYQQSPFWSHFRKIYDRVLKKAERCRGWEEENGFASVPFADYLLKTLLPYAPLWSTLLTPNKDHIVNTPVENHMKQEKSEKEENLKIGRFIDASYNRVTAACKVLSLSKTRNHQKRSRKRVNEPDDDDAEEQWNRGRQKRRKTDFCYQQGKNLQKTTKLLDKTLRFNDNYTITDPEYYFPVKYPPHPQIVSYDVNPYVDEYINLSAEDYGTLFHSRWLNNFLIDFWMLTRINLSGRSEEVLYIGCERSQHILEGKELSDDLLQKMRQSLELRSEILLPCNVNGNHWVLMYIDITESRIHYFDPIQRGKEKEEKLVEKNKKMKELGEIMAVNFMEFYKKIFPGTASGWWRRFTKYPPQTDNYNCGIFIIHFMEEILRGNIESITELDPAEKREELKHLILRQSLNVLQICYHCGQHESKTRAGDHWFQCKTCHRWAEFSCLHYLDATIEEMEDESYDLNCGLCSAWLMPNVE